MSETAATEAATDVRTDTKSSDDVKRKKKKSKPMDALLKDLPSDASDEDKIQLLCQKYHTLLQEQKDFNMKTKQYDHAIQSIRNERDQLQGERNRLMLQKDKLETLCRELQKQNKLVQDESLARCRAEDEKRRAISEHFQTSITSIQSQLNEYQTRNLELRKENQDLADKLESFIVQHKQREEHVEKIMHTRELESKLAEAKLQKAHCLLEQERVKSQQIAAQMKEEAKLMQERMDAHMTVENKLKEQIEFYKTKYQTFNKTIAQSNKLFDNAKTEMEKLVKRIKQSEHDVVEWRGKWELSQRSLLEVVSELKKKTEEAAAARKQTESLANLCRALRAQLSERHEAKGPDEQQGDVAHVGDQRSDETAQLCASVEETEKDDQVDQITNSLMTVQTEDALSEDIRVTEDAQSIEHTSQQSPSD